MQQTEQKCATCSASKRVDGKVLDKCGKCLAQLYCSSNCQKINWATHRLICRGATNNTATHTLIDNILPSLSSGETDTAFAIQGVHITAPIYDPLDDGYDYGREHVPIVLPKMLTQPGWVEVPLAQSLCGYKISMIRKKNLTPDHEEESDSVNQLADILAMDIDPESPSFGQSSWWEKPTGGFVLMRPDLQELDSRVVDELTVFARNKLHSFKMVKQREARGETVDRKKMVDRLLRQDKFETLSNQMRTVGIKLLH